MLLYRAFFYLVPSGGAPGCMKGLCVVYECHPPPSMCTCVGPSSKLPRIARPLPIPTVYLVFVCHLWKCATVHVLTANWCTVRYGTIHNTAIMQLLL